MIESGVRQPPVVNWVPETGSSPEAQGTLTQAVYSVLGARLVNVTLVSVVKTVVSRPPPVRFSLYVHRRAPVTHKAAWYSLVAGLS